MIHNLEGFLRKLFHAFNEEKLHYLVLRNYEGYPNSVHKPDIGILIAHSQQVRLVGIFRHVCQQLDLAVFIKPEPTNILTLWAIEMTNDGGERSESAIKVDARTYEVFKLTPLTKKLPGGGIKIFIDQVKRKRISQKGCEFFIFDQPDEFIFLMKQWQRKEDEKYRQKILQLLNDRPISEWFGSVTGLDHVESSQFLECPSSREFDSLLRRLVVDRWGKPSIRKFAKGQVHTLSVLFRRMAFRLPPIFYFSGPDGSGKTTTIDDVKDLLQHCQIPFKYFYSMHKFFRHIGFRYLWIKHKLSNPKTAMSFKELRGMGAGVMDRDTGRWTWRVGKRFSLLISWVDVWLGWILVTFYRIRGFVILVETSPFDLFAKYHMPHFPLLEKILAPLIPKPSQGFLLAANPESIVIRKRELTEEEIKKYYEHINRALKAAKCSSYESIWTEKGLFPTVKTIRYRVLEQINRRRFS